MFILFDSVRRPGVALRSPGGVDSSILIVIVSESALTGLDTSIVLSLLLISSSWFDLVAKNSSCLVFAPVFELAIWLAFTWQLKDRLSSRGRLTIYRSFPSSLCDISSRECRGHFYSAGLEPAANRQRCERMRPRTSATLRRGTKPVWSGEGGATTAKKTKRAWQGLAIYHPSSSVLINANAFISPLKGYLWFTVIFFNLIVTFLSL